MARTINRVELLGRVGADPEMRYTQGGTAITQLRLATDRHRQNGDTDTDWHSVTCWAKLAEAVNEYVEKGDRLYVSGRLCRTATRPRTDSAATAPRFTPPRSCSSTPATESARRMTKAAPPTPSRLRPRHPSSPPSTNRRLPEGATRGRPRREAVSEVWELVNETVLGVPLRRHQRRRDGDAASRYGPRADVAVAAFS